MKESNSNEVTDSLVAGKQRGDLQSHGEALLKLRGSQDAEIRAKGLARTTASDKYLADSCGKNNAGKDESVEAGFKSTFQYDLETQQLQAELDTLASAKKHFDKTA